VVEQIAEQEQLLEETKQEETVPEVPIKTEEV